MADHLLRTDTNESAELLELRGVAADDLREALEEMEAVAEGTRSTRPLYHASINTDPDEHLTDEQRTEAIDRLEAALGFEGQPRAVVEHIKEGREHIHVVWSRIDLEEMRAIPDSHNYRKHEEVARELEREFGHKHVQGAHIDREGPDGERIPRPARTPSHAEMQQAERTGITPEEAKELITELWQTTDSGKAFAAALEEKGWTLAHGDKRDFVLIDPNGGTHSLARRVDGAKAKDVRERMADIDAASLPTVEEARAHQHERQEERGLPAAPEIPAHVPAPAPTITVTHHTHHEHIEHQQEEHHGHHGAGSEIATTLLHGLVGHVILDALIDRTAEGIGHSHGAEAGEVAQEIGEGIKTAAELREVTEIVHEVTTPAEQKPHPTGIHVVVSGETIRLTRHVNRMTRDINSPTKISANEYLNNPAARQEYHRQEAAERERNAALGRMANDVAQGRNLNEADVEKLHGADLQNIRDKGDAGMLDLIRSHEHQQARQHEDRGRERD